ncbi:hypothetical protein ANCCEY_12682, partial [Ancylostoma ceylanicum]
MASRFLLYYAHYDSFGSSSYYGYPCSCELKQPVRQIDPVDRFAALIVRFARFEHVGQIPKEFVRKELELKGTVREILPSGELRVEHIPIVRLPSIFGRKKAPK